MVFQFTSNFASDAFAARMKPVLVKQRLERLPELVAVSAQRTVRLTKLLQAFSLVTRGEAGARLLANVGAPTSADTLLRLVKLNPIPVVKTRHPRSVSMTLLCVEGRRTAQSSSIF